MAKMAIKQKRKLPPSTAVVTQSNELVLARYSLPVSDDALLMTVIAKIQPGDTKLTVYPSPLPNLLIFWYIQKFGLRRNEIHQQVIVEPSGTIKKQDGGVTNTLGGIR